MFLDKLKSLLQEYYKYILVGAVVTIFDFFVLIFLTEVLNIYHICSGAVAFVMASFLHYYLSVKFVFFNRIFKCKKIEFLIFFIVGLIGLALFLGLFYWFTDVLGFYYVFSKVLATGISFTFNFLSRKYILFR